MFFLFFSPVPVFAFLFLLFLFVVRDYNGDDATSVAVARRYILLLLLPTSKTPVYQ